MKLSRLNQRKNRRNTNVYDLSMKPPIFETRPCLFQRKKGFKFMPVSKPKKMCDVRPISAACRVEFETENDHT